MDQILFVGESWFGSCSRSLKEALRRQRTVIVDELNEDLYISKPRRLFLRTINRLLASAYREELLQRLLAQCIADKPDALVVYKGWHLDADFVCRIKALHIPTVNIFPDVSPHAHGPRLQHALGCYDLVISTKSFHPGQWRTVYGYSNPCVYVPQGYDPGLHLFEQPVEDPRFDVVLAATWRPEYHELMHGLAQQLENAEVTLGICGHGWTHHRSDLPSHWTYAGPLHGRAYLNYLRAGRICIAPVTRRVVVGGRVQPGDEDTTRTYELAAAHCFFIHSRTGLAQSLYDEATEVPMFGDAGELAKEVLHYLPREHDRRAMADLAHARAVPAYSLDSRAAEVLEHVQRCAAEARGRVGQIG